MVRDHLNSLERPRYVGARPVRGLRGRGARGKTIVFGLKKRNGRVYTQVIKNCSKTAFLPLINKKISKDVTVYIDGFKTYDALVDMAYKKTLQSSSWKK